MPPNEDEPQRESENSQNDSITPSEEQETEHGTERESTRTISVSDFDNVQIPGADPVTTGEDKKGDHSDPIITIEDFDDINIPGAVTQPESSVQSESHTAEFDQIKEDTEQTESVMTSDPPSQHDSGTPDSVPDEDNADSDKIGSESSHTTPNESSESVEIDTDFSGVSITGADETPVEASTDTNTDDTLTDDSIDDPFDNADASETWGTTSSGTESSFSQTIDRDSSSTDGGIEDTTNRSDKETNPTIAVSEKQDQEEKPVEETPVGEPSIDTDFSGVDISGADTESEEESGTDPSFDKDTQCDSSKDDNEVTGDVTTDSCNEGPSEETLSSGATKIKGEEKTETESTGETRSDQGNTTGARRESISATDVPTPSVEPSQRIRSPGEMLLSPLYGVVETTKTAVVVLCALGLFLLRGTLIVAEWATSIFLIFYAIFVGMALIFPHGAIPHNGGATTRFGVIFEVSIVVIPTAIAVFTISMLVDQWLNDGKRYKSVSEPVFNRL